MNKLFHINKYDFTNLSISNLNLDNHSIEIEDFNNIFNYINIYKLFYIHKLNNNIYFIMYNNENKRIKYKLLEVR